MTEEGTTSVFHSSKNIDAQNGSIYLLRGIGNYSLVTQLNDPEKSIIEIYISV